VAVKLSEQIEALSEGRLRQLLAIQTAQPEIERLMLKRNELLASAGELQKRIDQLLLSLKEGWPSQSIGYGKRVGPTVKRMCEEIMLEAGEPMSAAVVKDRILERWPEKNSPTLYNQVFIALKRSKLIKKVAKGKFAVREGVRREKESGA
jgi:hypothetical protein